MSKPDTMVGISPKDEAEYQLTYGAQFKWYTHPRQQAILWSVPPLYRWQSDVLDELAMQRSRVVVTTPNGAGKTSLILPCIGLAIMNAFPGATVFSTAGAEEQIQGQLFKYLDAMIRPYERYGWKISSSGLTVKAPEVNGLASRWIGRVPRDAMTMEGYHGQMQKNNKGEWVYSPVIVILDEAKSLKNDILEAMFRINPDWALIISTPGKDEGMLYEAMDPDNLGPDLIAHGSDAADSKDLFSYRRIITWHDCPHLKTGENLKTNTRLQNKYGENSSFIRSYLYGQFSTDDDENRVFSEKDIVHLRAAMKIGKDAKVAHGTMKAAIDVSGGGDEQVLAIRCGAEVVYYQPERTKDTMGLASRWAKKLKDYNVLPVNCTGDSGGGYGEILKMIEAHHYMGIQRYMNNQAPHNAREYADRITEDTYGFKELLRRGGIKLPDDPELVKQARRRLFETSDTTKARGRVKLERKDKHRHRHASSPDRLETMVMLFADYLAPKVEQEKPYESPMEKKAKERGMQGGSFRGLIPQPGLPRIG